MYSQQKFQRVSILDFDAVYPWKSHSLTNRLKLDWNLDGSVNGPNFDGEIEGSRWSDCKRNERKCTQCLDKINASMC